MKNYDQAAIDAVFNNKTNFKKVITDVLAKFEEDFDEDMTFSEAMQLFLDIFEGIASESAAAKALEIDLQHYYLYNHRLMAANDVQYEIKFTQFKGKDKYVNLVLKNIVNQNYSTAYRHYLTLLNGWKLDKPEMNERWLNHYLVTLNGAIGTVCQSVNLKPILENLKEVVQKEKLKRKLEKNLAPTIKVKKLKI